MPGRLHFHFESLVKSLVLGLGPELQKCIHFQAQLEINIFWLGPGLGFCISLLVPWPILWSWVWDLSCKSTSTFKPNWKSIFSDWVLALASAFPFWCLGQFFGVGVATSAAKVPPLSNPTGNQHFLFGPWPWLPHFHFGALAYSLGLGLGAELQKCIHFQTQLEIINFWLGPGPDLLHLPFGVLDYSLELGLGLELQKCLSFQTQLEINIF